MVFIDIKRIGSSHRMQLAELEQRLHQRNNADANEEFNKHHGKSWFRCHPQFQDELEAKRRA